MNDAPPPYEVAAASGSSSVKPITTPANLASSTHGTGSATDRLNVRNGISPQSRRSMEDESRELPNGWTRQYDSKEHHQFFVDTKATPPRSIWHHPYDDEQYMSSISSQERARIHSLHRVPAQADMEAESSGDDHHWAELPPRPTEDENPTGLHRFGRKMKDKITNSTHEERELSRKERAEEEERAYKQHQVFRAAMAKAMETGRPQLVGVDRDGKEVYVDPPNSAGYDDGYGYSQRGGYGYSPYSQGMYANPNARFLSPQTPYSRPYGPGYGGGLGIPLGLGLGGGLMMGGLLGGGMMGGGMMGGGGMW